MIELLSKYSLTEIIIFVVLFSLAVKGLITFYDFIVERINKVLGKKIKKEKEKSEIEERLDGLENKISELNADHEMYKESIANICDKINLLISSDKDDIKSFITEKHHYFCYEKGWIDNYSLDCIEHRYEHYVSEGGNSFVHTLMEELRALPKENPNK